MGAAAKNDYEKQYGKYISKVNNRKYIIKKCIDGKNTYFGTYSTFQEAIEKRDWLIKISRGRTNNQ